MNSDEIWKPVVGYENLYEVSSLGRVRSLARMTKHAGMRGGGMLKPQKDHKGYLYVALCKNGKQKKYKVHRLVATAHIPNPLGLPEVNHINERKDQNFVENLEWCDNRYNCTYGSRAIKNVEMSQEVFQYTISGEFVACYPSTAEAERVTGVRSSHISACANGKCNTQGGYQWRYEPALFLDHTEGRFNNAQSKRIYQYDAQTGRFVKEWFSATEAQRQTGLNRSNICHCCKGKIKQAYGFRWFYEFQGLRINV